MIESFLVLMTHGQSTGPDLRKDSELVQAQQEEEGEDERKGLRMGVTSG